jgi:hypothetical protein
MTTALHAGQPIILIEPDGYRLDEIVLEVGQLGFRVDGRADVRWYKDEGKTWELARASK